MRKKNETKKMQKKDINLKFKLVKFVLIFILVGIFIFSGFKIYSWNNDNLKVKTIEKNILKNVTIDEIKPTATSTTPVNEPTDKNDIYWKYKDVSLIDVDINKLKNENSDTVGWIQVLGTTINYPVVQSTDNNYYLNRDFLKKPNGGGWIFLDYRNSLDNLASNNIIYGHRRYNNSMFGTLKNVLTKNWQDNTDNHIIKISSQTNNYLFQVFSVYSISNESYYLKTRFSTTEEHQTFIDTIMKRSVFNFNTTIDVNDKILTLSTCHGDGDRLVVHAKLIKINEKN